MASTPCKCLVRSRFRAPHQHSIRKWGHYKKHYARCLSSGPNKLAMGGHKWARMQHHQYAAVVESALEHGIATFEAGQDGESALVEAYKEAMDKIQNPPEATTTITMTARLGYRTIVGDNNRLQHDVTVEEHPFVGQEGEATSEVAQVVHNLSKEYVQQVLEASPLVKLRQEQCPDNMNLIYMLHNPEVQGQDAVLERMSEAFCGLEEGVANNTISSFGVCSNGLALPKDHPLHLDYKVVLEAAESASQTVHGSNNAQSSLSTLQLPVNLLETNGFLIARDIKDYLAKNDSVRTWYPNGNIDVYAMRPLTCYPSRGTGAEHPLSLVDYRMTMNDATVWTHEMEGPPPSYGMALNAAMGQFDATEILEASQERKLSTEERETLDGCKLLHSMLHDLDAALETVNSFAAYEEEIYNRVIPLIHDTFEELDDESGTILQNFFSAHGQAVRYAIASRTRALLKDGSKESPPYDIPDNTTLQEYALGFLLQEASIAKVVVGFDQPEQVIDAVNAAKSQE